MIKRIQVLGPLDNIIKLFWLLTRVSNYQYMTLFPNYFPPSDNMGLLLSIWMLVANYLKYLIFVPV